MYHYIFNFCSAPYLEHVPDEIKGGPFSAELIVLFLIFQSNKKNSLVSDYNNSKSVFFLFITITIPLSTFDFTTDLENTSLPHKNSHSALSSTTTN